MHAIGYQRLRAINLRNIKLPHYKRQDFAYLTDIVGYEGFRADLNNANRPFVLDRQVTEAAYLTALLSRYVAYDAAQLSEKFPGKEISMKKHIIFMALVQRSGVNLFKRSKTDPNLVTSKHDVEAYWKREKAVPWFEYCYDRLTPDVAESENTEMGEVDEGERIVPEDEEMLRNVACKETTSQ
ncbi:hypothetical protein BKA65DRAFT_537370 [Rhexocercosporidium sp. MPI-PUGE-AT-0058]|nr:hypothetical protein BKA65DRAFT_537370 [Rhexocercosporidium sp. MPI-PUGE-AT-0058]